MDAGTVLVDGELRDSIAASDRGLAFGDGVFRTLRVQGGRPLNWARHHERLASDCRLLRLPVPESAQLLHELGRVAPGDAIAKILVTRGASGRGYAPGAGTRATRIVMAFPPPSHPSQRAESGVRVRRCGLLLSEQPRLAGAKTLNRLENVLARAEWDDDSIHEGLLCDAADRVVEGTMSNVFVVRNGAVATPRLERCGVAGAQRSRVLALLAQSGIACEETDIPYAGLAAADEVFLTNSVIGAWPVASLETRTWVPGPVTRLAQRLIREDDARA